MAHHYCGPLVLSTLNLLIVQLVHGLITGFWAFWVSLILKVLVWLIVFIASSLSSSLTLFVVLELLLGAWVIREVKWGVRGTYCQIKILSSGSSILGILLRLYLLLLLTSWLAWIHHLANVQRPLIKMHVIAHLRRRRMEVGMSVGNRSLEHVSLNLLTHIELILLHTSHATWLLHNEGIQQILMNHHLLVVR